MIIGCGSHTAAHSSRVVETVEDGMLRLGRGLLHICRVSSSMPCCMRSCLSDSEEEMVLLGRHVIVGASQRVFVFDPPAMHGTRGLISEAGFEAAPAAARCSWLRFPLVYWGWCILWVSRGWRLAAGDVDSNRLQLLRLWRSWWTVFQCGPWPLPLGIVVFGAPVPGRGYGFCGPLSSLSVEASH